MKHLIVAVGGTGQMVLHYYYQLFMLGVVRESFQAIVIDTDDCISSLQFLRSFYDLVERGSADVPRFQHVPVRSGGGNSVYQVLTGKALPQGSGYSHPVDAFFLRDTLAQPSNQGLYARPALSAVVAGKQAMGLIEDRIVQDGTAAVVVGSAIGGTGGGLTIPVMSRLNRLARAHDHVTLRAVLLGRYFTPRSGMIENNIARFASNRTLFLKTLKERSLDLRSFAYIESPPMADRDPQAEKTARCLPWPAEKEPYWQALGALDYMLRDTTRDAAEKFVDREAGPELWGARINHSGAHQRLKNAIERTLALVGNRVVKRAAAEPFATGTWGEALTGMLHDYWELAARGSRRAMAELKGFPAGLQTEIQSLWKSRSGAYSLSDLFPSISHGKASVDEIRRAAWRAPRDDINPDEFASLQKAQSIAAANLLHASFHGGR